MGFVRIKWHSACKAVSCLMHNRLAINVNCHYPGSGWCGLKCQPNTYSGLEQLWTLILNDGWRWKATAVRKVASDWLCHGWVGRRETVLLKHLLSLSQPLRVSQFYLASQALILFLLCRRENGPKRKQAGQLSKRSWRGDPLLDSYKPDLSQFLEHFRVDTEVSTIILTSQVRKVGLSIREVSLVPPLEGWLPLSLCGSDLQQ